METKPLGNADVDNSNESISVTNPSTYHESVCGSILYCAPTNSTSEIFSYIHHGRFDAFRRSLEIYYKDIVQMKNEHGQTVLQVLAIYAHPYSWIRVSIMFGCDPTHQDHDGYTAAHYVAERDDVETLKALTTPIDSKVKVVSEEKKASLHERCLQALSIQNNQGLTVFMVAVRCESMKCLDYLLGLNINDANLQDKFGDTCLNYAVARRNLNLVTKLIDQCHADVNGGNSQRPGPLDIVYFSREQRKEFERVPENSIEQLLLSHNAVNRCHIKRVAKKRKRSCDDDDDITLSNLNIRTMNTVQNAQIETARDYARKASSLTSQGQFDQAKEYYKSALSSIPNDTLDWADYAYRLAVLCRIHGENQSALDLLQQALSIRMRFEHDTDDIEIIKRTIDAISKP